MVTDKQGARLFFSPDRYYNGIQTLPVRSETLDSIASPTTPGRSHSRSKIRQWCRRKTDRRLILPYTTIDYISLFVHLVQLVLSGLSQLQAKAQMQQNHVDHVPLFETVRP
jgi:hypothetical protein